MSAGCGRRGPGRRAGGPCVATCPAPSTRSSSCCREAVGARHDAPVRRRHGPVPIAHGDHSSTAAARTAAYMCKHIAAVLYGVGARLDREPGLLFTLRQVKEGNFVGDVGARAAASLVSGRDGVPGSRHMADKSSLSAVFGIDVAIGPPVEVPPGTPSPRAARRGPWPQEAVVCSEVGQTTTPRRPHACRFRAAIPLNG